jgi:ABC-type phosphate transport system substrate-binding protein
MHPGPMRRAILLSIGCAAAVAAGPRSSLPQTAVPGAADALAIIVNHSNPVDGLTLRELRRIFMLETQNWPNGRKITVVLREKGQPERAEAIKVICGISELAYDRHVLFQTFRGTVGWGPRSILSSSAMLRFVFNAPGAIGYVPADLADRAAKVLPIDGVLPGDPKYPLRHRVNRPDDGLER